MGAYLFVIHILKNLFMHTYIVMYYKYIQPSGSFCCTCVLLFCMLPPSFPGFPHSPLLSDRFSPASCLTHTNSLAQILSYFSPFSFKFLFVNFLLISKNEILLFMLFGMLFFSLYYILMLNIQQVKLIIGLIHSLQ